jgi:hypothetical protein
MADTAAATEETVPNQGQAKIRNGNVGRRLPNGCRAGNGRPKGRKNTATLVREAAGGKGVLASIEDGIPPLNLQPFVFRIAALLKHRNGFVRIATEKFVYEALHGKPKQQTDVNVSIKDPHDVLRRAAAAAEAMRDGTIDAVVVDARLLPAAPDGNGNGNGHK